MKNYAILVGISPKLTIKWGFDHENRGFHKPKWVTKMIIYQLVMTNIAMENHHF